MTFSLFGPPPLTQSACVSTAMKTTITVSFLITLTDRRMNGNEVFKNLMSMTDVRPNMTHVLIDIANKTEDAERFVSHRGKELLEFARDLHVLSNAPFMIEVVDATSCFGMQLTQLAFNNNTTKLYKTTYAYMWGMLRSLESRFVVHIDNDLTVLYPRSGLDWIDTGIQLLSKHSELLSVHPSSARGFGYSKRLPDCRYDGTICNCSNHECDCDEFCTCVDTRTCSTLVDGGALNAFKRAHVFQTTDGTPICGHTVNGLKRNRRHFSFEAWVSVPMYFIDMWPLPNSTMHIETIIDKLNVKFKRMPFWLPVSVGGWKTQSQRPTEHSCFY